MYIVTGEDGFPMALTREAGHVILCDPFVDVDKRLRPVALFESYDKARGAVRRTVRQYHREGKMWLGEDAFGIWRTRAAIFFR